MQMSTGVSIATGETPRRQVQNDANEYRCVYSNRWNSKQVSSEW